MHTIIGFVIKLCYYWTFNNPHKTVHAFISVLHHKISNLKSRIHQPPHHHPTRCTYKTMHTRSVMELVNNSQHVFGKTIGLCTSSPRIPSWLASLDESRRMRAERFDRHEAHNHNVIYRRVGNQFMYILLMATLGTGNPLQCVGRELYIWNKKALCFVVVLLQC